jgi:hypothetical protein
MRGTRALHPFTAAQKGSTARIKNPMLRRAVSAVR